MMPNSMIWSSLEISSLSSFVTSACEMGTLSSTSKPPLALNSLYINPHQFTFQLPLWQEMRKEGLPINISTTEKAVKIINGLKAAGIRHLAFKPGSVNGIRQVVNIAAATLLRRICSQTFSVRLRLFPSVLRPSIMFFPTILSFSIPFCSIHARIMFPFYPSHPFSLPH